MSDDIGRTKTSNPGRHFSVLLRIQFRLSLREPAGVGMGLIFPVLLLFLFGFISGFAPSIDGLTVIQYWISTIIVVTLMAVGMYSIPINLVRDREIGWLRRISTTPVSPFRLLVAQLVINVVIAIIAMAIVLLGSEYIFAADLHLQVLYFAISVVLTSWIMLSLGLLVAALAPTQRMAQGLTGGLFYPLLFFAGLWIQPEMVGEPLRSIMWYSPAGAAARSLLYSSYNAIPPYMELVAMIIYAGFFTFIATRYFRWG